MIHKLKAIQIDKIKKVGMTSDGGGLYLNVRKSGSKSWIYRYKINKKTVDMGLGSFPQVTLSAARQATEKYRKMKSDGLDPRAERDKKKSIAQNNNKIMTFSMCASAYIDAHQSEWSNHKHRQQWANTIKTYANPVIGDLAVDKVEVEHIIKILEPIWTTKNETATRVRGRIENILDWASIHKYRSNHNPARWKGQLDKLLPKPSKIQTIRHHPALDYREIGALMVKLRSHKCISAKALEFTILTGLRTKEVIGAKWEEIDLDSKIWNAPAERMKKKKLHRVPLSSSAIKVIAELPVLSDKKYLFPGIKQSQPICNASMLTLLQRPIGEAGMGYNTITVHGFRSTFRDWAAEQTSFAREVCEKALAHEVGSAVERAYQRGDMIEKRWELMEAWAEYIEDEFAQKKQLNSDIT